MAALNVKPNALFTNDCLYVLNGMNDACVDLIYLDPPFNSKRLYKAPVGSRAAGAAFEDMWTWADVDSALMVRLSETHPYLVDYITAIEVMHSKGMMAYIAYMAQRLLEMHRVLKPTGSIYLHCDPTASHYLKIVMDRIFGKNNFRNEIVWCYRTGGASKKFFGRKHDILLFYSKSDNYNFSISKERSYLTGQLRHSQKNETLTDENGQYQNILFSKTNIKLYKDERGYYTMAGCRDYWNIDAVGRTSKERTGYPTQKPVALLGRIIQASSSEGDVVLDPFCGCATTCVAAQQLNRRWLGIDLSDKTEPLIRERLADDVGAMFDDFDHYTGPPCRDDVEHMTKKEAKPILYGTQEGHCAGCKDHFEARHLEVDHYIPKSKGGGDYLANYQLMCGNCNRIKGNRPMDYLLSVLEKRKAKRRFFGATPSSSENL